MMNQLNVSTQKSKGLHSGSLKIFMVSFHFVEYAIELANGLAQENRVHLMLLKRRVDETVGDRLTEQLHRNVSFTLLPYQSFIHPHSPISLFHIFNQLKDFRPDVIHLQESWNILNLIFLLMHSIPVVVTVHDVHLHAGKEADSAKKWKLKLMNRVRKHRYAKVILHGERLKKLYSQEYSLPIRNLHVIPHGCLHSYLDGQTPASESRTEPHTVLFFGRIQKYKGLEHLIAAEPFVSEAIGDFKIVVAGKGEDMDRHKAFMLSNPHFEVHDRFIPMAEVPLFFRRAAAIILPYIEASQSGIAAMAFAFGKPVIATCVGSLPEMVEHDKTGIIVAPGDTVALRQAIIELLSNPAKRQSLSENAQRAALTKFSWQNIAEKTEKVYRQAIVSNG